MNPAGQNPEAIALYVESGGALLFCLVFLFLWRQSGIVYFRLWSLAWLTHAAAEASGHLYARGHGGWLVAYAVLEFAYAVLLVAAARAGFAGSLREWRSTLKLLWALPAFGALLYYLGRSSRLDAFHTGHALVLCGIYLYNFTSLRAGHGVGRKLFRWSLLAISLVMLHHALLWLWIAQGGRQPAWAVHLRYETFYDFGLHVLLAFAAMAMWIEDQHQRVREITAERDQVRRQSLRDRNLDSLTGLGSQAALAMRMEDSESFEGAVVVCDMDNFKDINDRYGHLAGDEILRNVGHLLRSSIRHEDEAFRWGGDEFVILFRHMRRELAEDRMHEVCHRLQAFQVRGHGTLPIWMSWGTAEGEGRALRELLEEADQSMYLLKRSRNAGHHDLRA